MIESDREASSSGSGERRSGGTGRTPRGRVLIVEPFPWTPSLPSGLPSPPEHVASVAHAIGAVHASETRRPIIAIVLTTDVGRANPTFADELRHVDPSVMLIAVGDSSLDQADVTVMPDGIASEVASALGLPSDAADSRASDFAGAGDTPRGEGTVPTDDDAQREEPLIETFLGSDRGVPAGTDPEADALRDQWPTPADPGTHADDFTRMPVSSSASDAMPEAPADSSAGVDAADDPPEPLPFVAHASDGPGGDAALQTPLGDLDLVDAVLAEDGGLAPLAAELIRQQTGWLDLMWFADQDGDARSVSERVVRDGARMFGRLRSRMASPVELERWAEWLARWLRLEATVRDAREHALRDELTGAWNRRFCMRFLTQTVAEASARRRPVTVLFFDIDDFKRFNDTWGHDAGDDILRETVKLLQSGIRRCDRVCRIGGDEFVVIFADLEGPRTQGSSPVSDVEVIAHRFQREIHAMRFPKLGIDAPGRLSISGGLATFPWDGHDADSLIRLADQRALESKRRGKNLITVGTAPKP